MNLLPSLPPMIFHSSGLFLIPDLGWAVFRHTSNRVIDGVSALKLSSFIFLPPLVCVRYYKNPYISKISKVKHREILYVPSWIFRPKAF